MTNKPVSTEDYLKSQPKSEPIKPSKLSRGAVYDNAASLRGDGQAQIARGVKETYRKLREIGGLDILSEATGVMPQQRGQGIPEAPIKYDGYSGKGVPSSEDWATPLKRPGHPQGSWQATMVIKETASGKQLTRWRAMDGKKKTFGHDFRHEPVATMVAACLNETNGNERDPRIVRILELCSQEDALLRDLSAAKHSGKNPDRVENARLKLENVRLRLNVR